jgi:hypothetical protein
MVSESGVVPLPRYVEAISSLLPPTDLRQLQRFSRFINFYHWFLLRGAPKALQWSPAAGAVFTKAKAALVAAVPLLHQAPCSVLSLAVDASDTHVGGSCNSCRAAPGSHWHYFQKSIFPNSPGIPPSVVGSWRLSSVSSWRAAVSAS